MLWTAAGRDHISHWCIRTSNGAEGEFKVGKNTVMDGVAISDAGRYLYKQIGTPEDLDAIQNSRFMALVIRIAHIEGGDTNMRLPTRVFITPMRQHIAEILEHRAGVLDVSEFVYDVAGASARTALRSRKAATGNASDSGEAVDGAARVTVPLCSGYYRVHIIHGCTCKFVGFFCKHLLSARKKHLLLGRQCCWRDAELSALHTSSEVASGIVGLSVADAFSSIVEDAAGGESPSLDANDVNRMLRMQTDVLTAKLAGFASAMEILLDYEIPVIALGATIRELDAGVSRTKSLGRLTETIGRASASALQLAGHTGVSAAGRRPHDRSARSIQEFSARSTRTSQLQFVGAIGLPQAVSLAVVSGSHIGASVMAGTCRGASVSGNVALSGMKRSLASISGASSAAGHTLSPAAAPAAVASAAAALIRSAQLTTMGSQTAQAYTASDTLAVDTARSSGTGTHTDEITRLRAQIASLQGRVDRRDRRIDKLEAAAETAAESARLEGYCEGSQDGAHAAYSDSATRIREVAASHWYTDNKPVRQALKKVARALEKLAVEQ